MAEPVSSTGPSSSSQGHRPDSSKTVSIPANTSRGSFALSVSSMSLPDALPDTDDEILSTAPSSTYTSLKDSFRSKEYARSCLGHGRELAHDRREEICLHAGCRRPFTRSFDLNRHVRTHFPATAQRFDCPKGPGGFCGRIGERAFTRQDHLDEHLRKVHLVNIPRSARGSREERAENQPAEATSKENTEEGNVTAISGTRMKDSAGKLGTNQSAGSISSYRNNDEAHSQKEWQPSAMALDDESQPETLVESHQNENSPKISDESKETTGSGKEVIDTVDRSKIIDQPRLIVRLKIPKDLRKACLQILDMQPRPNIIPRQSIDQRKPSVEDASSALQMRHSQHQPIAQGKALKDQDVKPERTTSASTHYRSPWRLETWLAEVQRNLLAKQRPRKPHQRVASKQLEIYCPVCSTSFIAFGELRAHLITEHELQLYFWCPTQGCIEPVHRTPDSLLDHRYEEHQLPTSEIDSYFEECCSQRRIYRCLGENCNIGNLQTDDLLKHLYEKHGGAEPETKKAQPTGFTIIPRTDTWKRTSSAIVMLNYLLEDHSTAQEGTWTDYLYDSIAPTTITRPEPRSEAISTIVKVYLAIRITGAAQNATLSVVLAVLLVVWIWYMATVEFKMLLGSFLFQCVSSLANATLAEPPVAAGKTRIHWTCVSYSLPTNK